MPAKNFDDVSFKMMNTTTSNFFSFVSKPVIIRLDQFEIENFNSLSPADVTTVTTISSEKDCRAELEQGVHEPDCFFFDHVTTAASSEDTRGKLYSRSISRYARERRTAKERVCVCVCVCIHLMRVWGSNMC